MVTDHPWVEVYEVVLAALVEDAAVHEHPPSDTDEVGHIAETVTDHLVGQFEFTKRRRS